MCIIEWYKLSFYIIAFNNGKRKNHSLHNKHGFNVNFFYILSLSLFPFFVSCVCCWTKGRKISHRKKIQPNDSMKFMNSQHHKFTYHGISAINKLSFYPFVRGSDLPFPQMFPIFLYVFYISPSQLHDDEHFIFPFFFQQ